MLRLGEKIMIIGSSGSGKSSLAKILAKQKKLPVIHLDEHYWLKNWEPIDQDLWQRKVKNLCGQDSWIMDGNYSSTLALRLEYADTVIYLDIRVGNVCITF